MKLLIIITLIILASCKGGSSSSSEASKSSDDNIAVSTEHMIADGIYTLGCFNNEYFLSSLGTNQTIELDVTGNNFEVRIKQYGNMACTNLQFEYIHRGNFTYDVSENDESPTGYDIKVEYFVTESWVKDLTVVANMFNSCGGNYTDNDWHEVSNSGCDWDETNETNLLWKITHYDNGDFDTKGLHGATMQDFEFTKQ